MYLFMVIRMCHVPLGWESVAIILRGGLKIMSLEITVANGLCLQIEMCLAISALYK